MLRTFDVDAYEKEQYIQYATKWFTQKLIDEVIRIRRHNTKNYTPHPTSCCHTTLDYETTLSFNEMHRNPTCPTVSLLLLHRYVSEVATNLRELFPDIKMKVKYNLGVHEIIFDWSEH